MKHIIAIAMAAAVTACAQSPYKVIAPLNDVEDGQYAYLYNYDTEEQLDSVKIADHSATFRGNIDEPIIALIAAGETQVRPFILEQGTIAINPHEGYATGSMLNDIDREYQDSLASLAEQFGDARRAGNQDLMMKVLDDVNALALTTIDDNSDNPVGVLALLDYADVAEPEEVMAVIEKYPYLQQFKRVQAIVEVNKKKEETSVGHKYKDFEVEYDGSKQKFSEMLNPDGYTLVDFWASWCGPCVRQLPVLKELKEKYADKDLQVLGVAVWDEPENTLKAIEKHELTWPVMINAQTIPTDIYGIQGIPCIMLIGPDGTILSRDKQDDELRADVAAALEN